MATVQELEAQVAALKELLQQRSETPAPQATPIDNAITARQTSQANDLGGQRRDAQCQALPGQINAAWQQQKNGIPAMGLRPVPKGGSQ